MAVTYNNSSVYRNTAKNEKYLETYEPPVTVNLDRVRTITVQAKYTNRPDLLAYDLYGDSKLWWVFTLYNRDLIVDPLYDLVSGMKIQVPISSSDIGV